MNIGTNIKKHRKARGWTQGDLADAAGVSRTTIVAIEKSHWTPKPETLEAIAEAMGLERPDLDTPPAKQMSDREIYNSVIHMMQELREREARR